MSEYNLLKEYEDAKSHLENLKLGIVRISKLHQIAKNSGNEEEANKYLEIKKKLQLKMEEVRELLSVL